MFECWKKIQGRTLFHYLWKWYAIQISASINKVSWHVATLIWLFIVSGCSHTTTAKLSSCGRHPVACDNWNIYHPALCSQSLLMSELLENREWCVTTLQKSLLHLPSLEDSLEVYKSRWKLLLIQARYLLRWCISQDMPGCAVVTSKPSSLVSHSKYISIIGCVVFFSISIFTAGSRLRGKLLLGTL